MKAYRYRFNQPHPRHYMEDGGQHTTPAILTPGKKPGNHWIGGWVAPSADLDALEKNLLSLPGFELQIVQPMA